MTPNDPYEIYAVKYAGPNPNSGAFVLWMRDWEVEDSRNNYLWVVKNSEHTIVVDTGIEPGLAEKRPVPGYENPAEVLERMGVKAREVEHVMLTHLHWDHAGGVQLFPNAAFYVQKHEFDFWVNDPMALKPPLFFVSDRAGLDHLASLQGGSRLKLCEGDQDILPGLRCLWAPGHTPGMQALAVQTEKGTAVLGSDCGHIFRNYAEDWPSSIFTDMPELLRTYEKLKAAVSSPELLFPGHDRLMNEDYPQAAPGITRLV